MSTSTSHLNKRPRSADFRPNSMNLDAPSAPEPETPPIPSAVMNHINKHARSLASIQCAIANAQLRIQNLQDAKTNGIVPKHLEYKFKKLFTKPEELNLRVIVINNTIDSEIQALNLRITELTNVDTNGMTTLMQTLTPIFNNCDIHINPIVIHNHLDTLKSSHKLRFLLKQYEDNKKKETKQAKFAATSTAAAEPATITVKDVTSMKAIITSLQKQVKSLSMNKQNSRHKQGNAKGAPKSRPSAAPGRNSTKEEKKSAGKKQGTARDKKSRGKNGKQ